MKGFGHLGHGVSFPSSSNLSPLAPPFTVDSSFPKPTRHHPLGHPTEPPHFDEPYFDDDPHYAFTVSPPQDNWPHIDTSTFGPKLFSSPAVVSGTKVNHHQADTEPAVSSAYNFFSTQSISRPYHPQCPSASFQDSSTSLSSNERGNMLPNSCFAPKSPGNSFWGEKSGGEHWRGKDTKSATPPSYASLVKQGISATDGLPVCEETSNVWVGKSVDPLVGKYYVESHCTSSPVGKLSSALDETSRNAPFDMSGTVDLHAALFQEMPHHQAPSSDSMMEPWSKLNPSIAPYGRYFTGFDSYKADPLCFYPSAANSSVDQIYNGAPSGSGNSSTHMNRTLSGSMAPIERPRDACDRKEAFPSHRPLNTGYIQGGVESDSVNGDISSTKDGVDDHVHVCADPSRMKNIVLPQHSLVSVDPFSKASKKVQVTDFNIPATLVTAETGQGDSFERSSEVIEQFNPGVDSPCWKGALDSRYSLFGAAECGIQHIPTKIAEECNSFNLQVPSNHHVDSDKAVAFSSPEMQQNETYYREDGSSPFAKQSSPVSLLSGDKCSNIHKAGSSHFQMNNENVIHSASSNMGDGSDVEPSQTIKFGYHEGTAALRKVISEKIADTGFDVENVEQFGSDWVPYHVSDHYSSLSSSRGNVPIANNLTEPLLGAPNTLTGSQISRAHVQTVVNSMHNLSELLLSYCSKDVDALKEQDHVIIQQVVQNLDTCLSRSGTMESLPTTQFLQAEIPNYSEKQTNIHKGTVAERFLATNTEVKDAESRCYIPNDCEEKKNATIFSKKEDKSPEQAFPNVNPEFEQVDMTKGIKKILEENFYDEEQPNLQSLLYKNLWLEAEAALCSVKYKARFARMKIEMEKHKQHVVKEPIDVENLPSSNVSVELNKDNKGESTSKESVDSKVPYVEMPDHNPKPSGTGIPTEDVDASIMARFRILKSRVDSKNNKEEQLYDSVKGNTDAVVEVALPKLSNESSEDIVVKPQQPEIVNLSFAERRNPWPFLRDSSEVNDLPNVEDHFGIKYRKHNLGSDLDLSEQQDLVEFGVMQSAASATNILVDRLSVSECDSPSSEWEHVLKEAAWPA